MLADHGLIEERRQLLDDQQTLTDEATALLALPEPDPDVLADIWAQSRGLDTYIEALSVVIFSQQMGWMS